MEIPQHRIPVEWRLERQPQDEAAVGNQTVADTAAGPKLVRRRPKHLTADAVQLTHAAEARRERNLSDREVCVVEQPSRKMCPARAGKMVRRHPQVFTEQPAQVPG